MAMAAAVSTDSNARHRQHLDGTGTAHSDADSADETFDDFDERQLDLNASVDSAIMEYIRYAHTAHLFPAAITASSPA